MTEYVIKWETGHTAETPREAARLALADILREGSLARVFTVTGPNGAEVTIDLSEGPDVDLSTDSTWALTAPDGSVLDRFATEVLTKI